MELADLRLVTMLARSESLSAAARVLNVTPSALSMRLKKLEKTLGVTLATRDARHMSLTADGARLAREAQGLLSAIEALPDTFREQTAQLAGHIRIAAPFGFGRVHIAPLLARFARANPGIRLQLDLLETPWPHSHAADVVIQIGTVRDSSWSARPLLANERWLCASPGYIAARGYPREPREILEHDCICIRENDEDVTLWRVRRRRSEAGREAGRKPSAPTTLRVTPAFTTNDGSVARRWAEEGLGLVLRSQWDVADAVAAGRLVRLLSDWDFGSAPVIALVPTRKGRSLRIQALLSYLAANLGAEVSGEMPKGH
ncbi:LysR family transcriptional regulator [Caballeronia mineralivorans PML1(12)]|uniref:LysR family transcriptional regulator n=1 Tax=Caballeronia mineralivorans PML1(12) TaxID=908627 RepID=A0A0J1CU72_9BURK|nr:LysR family transcriptional regulator [Caballeronia mineralivorans]KLU23886.1 LysR family transcriptional regulator [Caballeronia mineralivorans PML1(12)]